jgi:F0F1-type ATP synthase membrane subunit b/b'
MEIQATSFSGLWSTITGVFKTSLATMAGISATGEVVVGGFFDNLKKKMQLVVDKLAEWQKNGSMEEWASKASAAFNTFWAIASVVFDGIVAFAKLIISHWNLIGPVLAGVLAGFLAYRTVTGVITAVTTAQKLLNLAMNMNPIGLLVTAIGLLVAAGVYLYQNWDKISAQGKKLWTAIQKVWDDIKATCLNAIKEAVSWGKNLVEGIWEGITNAREWIKGKFTEWVGDVTSFIKQLFGIASPSTVMAEMGKNLVEGLALGIKNASDKVKEAAMGMVEGMMESVKSVTEQYNTDVAQAMETFRQQEEALTQEYQQQLDARTQALYGWIGIFDEVPKKMQVTGAEVLGNLRDQINYFNDWQQEIARLAKKGVDEGLIEELQSMGPKALPEIEALNSLSSTKLEEYVSMWKQKHEMAKTQSTLELQGLKDQTAVKIEELRTKTNDQLKQYAIDFLTKIKGIKTDTLTQLGEMASKGVQIGSNLITNIISGISQKKAALAATMESVAEMMAILPGGAVPALASGGIVTRPTLAMVGEAGPEAIIPLNSSNSYGGPITINVNGAGDPDAVANAVMRKLSLAGGRY